jgi:hypothetical protein
MDKTRTAIIGAAALAAIAQTPKDLRDIAKAMKEIPFMVLVPDRRPGAAIGARMPAVANGVGELFAQMANDLHDARERIAKLEEKGR